MPRFDLFLRSSSFFFFSCFVLLKLVMNARACYKYLWFMNYESAQMTQSFQNKHNNYDTLKSLSFCQWTFSLEKKYISNFSSPFFPKSKGWWRLRCSKITSGDLNDLSLLFTKLKLNKTSLQRQIWLLLLERKGQGERHCALVSCNKHDTAYLFFPFPKH